MATVMPDPPAPTDQQELDVRALERYLQEVLGRSLAGPLRYDLIPGGRSNPTYVLSDGETDWILRRPPYGHVLQSAHDMSREVRVTSALADTAVPVPHVVAYTDDLSVIGAPFYVMSKLVGRTFRTHQDTALLTPAQRAGLTLSLVDLLATLHEVNPADVGLAEWGRPDGYLKRQLQRWGRQWDMVATAPRPEVAVLLRRLNASMPELRFPGVVHGDFKIDNVMVDVVDPTKVVGLLDWEMSTLGDTLADLGILVSFWDEVGELYNPITAGATAHPGFLSVNDVIDAYASRRGISVDGLDWYVVFADFKIAVVLEQIHARHLAGGTTGDWFDDIGAMVGPLLERALRRAEASSDEVLSGRAGD